MSRYERKFLIEGIHLSEIENCIYTNPGMFFEIYEDRFVNNIYLDTIELASFKDNLSGIMDRIKFRIRWYGDLHGLVRNPNLELKIKTGFVGDKNIYHLKPFEFKLGSCFNEILKNLLKSDIPNNIEQRLKFLMPVIVNRYRRKYFSSFDRKYRITVDTNQSFCGVSGNNIVSSKNNNTCDFNTILELKYNVQHETNARYITNHFPFRMTKSSKYVNAIINSYF
jgi:hypothetical protein|tara:strand:+ start:3937 stop:4608 length:672 start_codon:yes stop_codon:yes gene_type:complete